jgi:hypothetical protein
VVSLKNKTQFKTNTDTIMDKRLEEIKVKGDKVRKSLAEEQKSIREARGSQEADSDNESIR